MNDLHLKTINLVPATIEFNKQAILDELNETLKKYDSLVFTEDNTSDIRKVLAELRKGKTAADEFRKSKKKEAVAPITAFEKDVKEIVKLFDDVIDPINEQLKEYEENRKAEKYAEIETIISETVEKTGLEIKFANQLTVDDQYLNKSTTLNQVKESIEFRAENLLNEQKLEHMNKENVESFVMLKNSEHDMELSVVPYLSQLEFQSIEDVKSTVEDDVQKELNRRSREEAEKKAKEEMAQKEMQEMSNQALDNVPFEPTPKEMDNPIIEDLPFGDIAPDEHVHTISFVVTAQESKFNTIRAFMDSQGIEWREE